jgi:gliding motility-associated-like protein
VPAENAQVQLCNTEEFTLSAEAREGTKFSWRFKPLDRDDDYHVIDGQTSGQLLAKENGYYIAQGTYGFCSFESSPVLLQFVRDELFVPNVFTPNGDDKNQVFKVETNSTISRFTIFNRFGAEVNSNVAGEWDGGEAPAGVYFWYLKYNGCDQQKEAKGWVQLLR